jgi:hypothetical protein
MLFFQRDTYPPEINHLKKLDEKEEIREGTEGEGGIEGGMDGKIQRREEGKHRRRDGGKET